MSTALEQIAAGTVPDLEPVRAGTSLTVRRTSAFTSFASRTKPDLLGDQVRAAARFERDALGTPGRSNAATIGDHMGRAVEATAEERRAAAFGRQMRAARDSGGFRDYAADALDRASRMAFVRERLSRVSWFMLDAVLVRDLSPAEVARLLNESPQFAALRLREALAELAGLYRRFDARERKH